jgi:TusA-related sulfurtransferase
LSVSSPQKANELPGSSANHDPKTIRKFLFDPHFFQLASALLIGMASMSRDEPINVFDLRDAIIPFSLLDIRHRFKEMQLGDSLIVLWNDATAIDDLMRVLPSACLEIVSKGEIPEPSGGFRMELIKVRMEPAPTRGILCHK